MWALLCASAAAEPTQLGAPAESGPWGLGGAYMFGFLGGFALFGVGVAMRIRKSHLAEMGT
jgi:hypothetical protein